MVAPFSTEDEWRAAYDAAYNELAIEFAGLGSTYIRQLACRIVNRAIGEGLAAADISTLPGVEVERVGQGTPHKYDAQVALYINKNSLPGPNFFTQGQQASLYRDAVHRIIEENYPAGSPD